MIPTLLFHTFIFRNRTFLKHRRVPIWSSSVLWAKQWFSRSRDNPPFPLTLAPQIQKTRRYQVLSKIRNGSFTNLLRIVRWNKFDGKSWYPISHLLKFSISEVFSKTERFRYEVLLSCETTIFRREIAILHPSSLPTPSYPKNSSIPNFSQNREGFD